MTVLRSREILSTVAPKASETPAPKNVVVEPVTPSKTFEFLNQSSNTSTPSPSSCAQNCENRESGLGSGGGSVMDVESGSLRRRSARLATKVAIGCYSGSVEIIGRKKKRVEGSNGEICVKNLERLVLDVKDGVEKSGVICEASVNGWSLQSLDHGSVPELVPGREGVKNDGSVVKLGMDLDAEAYGMETVNNGRRKRNFSMEVKSLGSNSHEKGEVEKGLLSLRSGRKVVKRGMEADIGTGNGLEDIEISKRSDIVTSGDDLVETRSASSIEKLENGHLKENGFSREEKAKGKVPCETVMMSGSVSVNLEVVDRVEKLLVDSHSDSMDSPKSINSKVLVKDKGNIITENGVRTRGRLSKEGKSKTKLGLKNSSFNEIRALEGNIENVDSGSLSGTVHSTADEAMQDGVHARETDLTANDARSACMERFRNIARQNASRFAHFSSQEEFGNHSPDVTGRETPLPEADNETEDWPGPFSTAMKIIKDRETSKYGERNGSSTDKSQAVELKWIPKQQESGKPQRQVPSLQDLCLSILSHNSDAISSLDFIPDVLRHKICWFLCGCRKMNGHFLKLLLHGSPTEIRVRDCSWLSEELFTRAFEGCNTNKLMVLQFDQCGGCMPDYILYATLACSPNSLPSLTTISLRGAYRFSDTGLSMLASSAPSLKSVDVSQCPLLTSEGICCLANSLRSVLRELYLDNCQGVDAMLILPALLNLENLAVLSVAGIQTVCDEFISEFISARGCRMKELVLADCTELTDLSLKIIGDKCSELCAIDLTNLCKLTDVSIGHLANGCQGIRKLNFRRNAFSDEAVAAYLDLRGASLKDLSLNNIIQISNHTALSLARNCRNLLRLDLSWCRNLTNEALGLIVDSCLSLEFLKLFGCTQVTSAFLDGHSNPQVKLIGLKMTPALNHIDVPDFLLAALRY